MINNKKVLIITYNFPPANSPGVYRILGFLRYLPLYGFSSLVVTAMKPFGDAIDHNLLKNVPADAKVYRTFSFEFDRIKERIHRVLFRIDKNNNAKLKITIRKNISTKKKISSILNKFFSNYVFIPDTRIGWIPSAFLKSLALCYCDTVDIIFTSSPPDSLQLIGLILKKITRKKWVADFRDPFRYNNLNSKFRNAILSLIEKMVVKNADFLIANTPGMKQMICEKYHSIDESKIVVINNGFDAQVINAMIKKDCSRNEIYHGLLNITFIGTVYPGIAEGFFSALKEMKDKKEANGLKVFIVGTLAETEIILLDKYKIRDLVDYVGFVSYEESLRYMLKADILLLLSNKNDKSWIPSKLFSYLLTNKPILAVAPEGDVSDILRKTRTGISVLPNNIIEIKAVIKDMLNKFQNGRLSINPDWNEIQKYDLRVLTQNLANVFNGIKSKNQA